MNARHDGSIKGSISIGAALRQVLVFIVAPIVFAYVFAALVAGCGASLEEIDKASGVVADKLQKCRGEARADFYVGKKSVEESMQTYESCKKREGL